MIDCPGDAFHQSFVVITTRRRRHAQRRFVKQFECVDCFASLVTGSNRFPGLDQFAAVVRIFKNHTVAAVFRIIPVVIEQYGSRVFVYGHCVDYEICNQSIFVLTDEGPQHRPGDFDADSMSE